MPPKMGKRKTMVNNQLESKGCPVSARRKLNPKSTMISDRRLNLRSSKLLVETGTPSLTRSSQPHKSRGHSSASSAAADDIKQTDVPAAHPPTLEPELGQKEAKKVENSTVHIQEMMEEEDKAENPLSNHSRTGCSPPALSLRVTEFLAMAGDEDEDDEDEDEVDSEIQNRAEDNVNGYKVKTKLMPILRKIIYKHGDIAKNCTLRLARLRSALLEMICEIISELENNDFTKIKQKDLEMKIADVEGIEEQNVEVQWLHTRLTDILEAKRVCSKLKEKMDINRESVGIAESAMVECEAQIKKLEDQKDDWKVKLANSKDELARTYNETISAAKVNRYRNSSLVDDLL